MRGSVRQRAQTGGWEYIIDIGMHPAQRCQACGRRFWIERRPKESCPKCGGELRETDERRRETKGGFATRKECVAAMNKLLVSVEEHDHVVPHTGHGARVPDQGVAAGDQGHGEILDL